MQSTAGYSGTPLVKKLGITESSRVFVVNPPTDYERLVEPLPAGVAFEAQASQAIDIAHIFVTKKEDLAKRLAVLRQALRPNATVWVSFDMRGGPKGAK